MRNLTLVSHHLCPYVQRAAISLAEKNVPFERVTVDLSNKPDWFKAISPLGKVPLLRVRRNGEDEVVVFESAVILELLEETEAHPLHPADPYLRARHRAFVELASAILNGIGRFYSAATAAALQQETEALGALFARVESELEINGRGNGPWFAGTSFSLVDAAFAPVFRYFDVFDAVADFGVLSDKPRIAAWRSALAARPSVIAAVTNDYPERLLVFLVARNSYLSAVIQASAPAKEVA